MKPEQFVRFSPKGRMVVGYIKRDSGCWEWTGTIDRCGYGKWGNLMAHRVVFVSLVGPIPGGLEIDHLCRNRACVNPEHLEAVTHKENMLRGKTWGAANARKTHCPRGHEYSPENTRIHKGSRECRICNRVRQRTGGTPRKPPYA